MWSCDPTVRQLPDGLPRDGQLIRLPVYFFIPWDIRRSYRNVIDIAMSELYFYDRG
jgi:hypothetical protein